MKAIKLNTSPVLLQSLHHPLFNKFDIDVQVLRLDTLHPVISGNKWLKLLPWLQEAQQQRVSGILTKGGPYSNHVHAAAYAAMLYHFSCTAVIKAKEGMSTAMLNDTRRWNANIIYAPANYDDDDKWAALAAEKNLLFIPMGGDGKLAAAGVCHFLRQSSIPLYNHVFCPVGTGTTLRGIAASGIAANRLTGINPGIKDGFKIFLAETQKTCSASIDIIKNDSLKKFGQWPLFLPGMMNDWYRHWDLPTDVVYTAKMVFIFLEMIKKETIEAGSTCLLVHTGGLQGNRSLVPGLLIF